MSFDDEDIDRDPHGECRAEIARLTAKLATAKRIGREFAAMCAANKHTAEMLAEMEAL